MQSPRPILKRPATSPQHPHVPHHGVHFPPSPSLTTHTFSVYSASVYDRSPIVVAPNSCALPERGCPGRTYNLDDDPAPSLYPTQAGHYYGPGDLHPRAFYGASRSISQPPPLIPDLSSSESDESDGVPSPQLESSHVTIPSHLHGLAIPHDKYNNHPFDGAYPTSSPALSFLPHPPSPPSRSHFSYRSSVPDDTQDQKPRRNWERKHEGSYDLGRIPGGTAIVQQNTSPRKRKSRVSDLSKSLSTCHVTTDFRIEDDGCLGGF